MMAELPIIIVENSGTLPPLANAVQRAKAVVDFQGAVAGSVYSGCRWQLEPSDTMLRYDAGEGGMVWNVPVVDQAVLCVTQSMLLQRQSNAGYAARDAFSTVGHTLSNEVHSLSPMETEEIVEALGGRFLLSNRTRVKVQRPVSRYFEPLTPVAKRIDELILEEQGQEDVLLDRCEQAKWLKGVLASYWSLDLPQPYMGFDLEDGLFMASWQSDDECNTLMIDAKKRVGWYEPWPAGETDNPILGEIDLDTEEAWESLRIALMTGRL